MTDMWNGEPLPERGVAHTDLNYRLYDRRTGTLLSFNSTNSVDALAADVLRTQKEHPDAAICAVEYDGPAWPTPTRSTTGPRWLRTLRHLVKGTPR